MISEASAESIDAWSLASCSALSEAVELPPVAVEPAVAELPPVGFDPELDCVDVPELDVVPDPLGVEPPELVGFEALPEAPDPVPAPDDELDVEDELRSLASAVSALASAAWSVWTCCWADWALARALRQAALVELPEVDVELPVAVVVDAGGVVVGFVEGFVDGVVDGAVPVDEVEQAVWASLSAASAMVVSLSAVCCAVTTACWALVRVAVELLGPLPEGVGGEVVVVVVVVAVVAPAEPVSLEAELELDCEVSSSESLASAAVRVVWAEETSFSRVVVFRDASVCPDVTCWPRETSTAATVPATWKSDVAWCTADAVPVTFRVLLTEAVVAVPVR